jgi:nucleoside-diphosphate-sugar epimerase
VVEVLFHLAAAVRGGEDVQFAATVVGTERLLEAMARSGTHRLLLASSFQVDLPRQGKAAGPARPLPVRGPVQAAAV